MQYQSNQTNKVKRPAFKNPALYPYSLRTRSDELLVSIAVFGLVATVSDGEADRREIETFTKGFKKQFALSRQSANKIIGAALQRIKHADKVNPIDCASDSLNENLTLEQKVRIYFWIADIMISDGVVHEGEVSFQDYIAEKLKLQPFLEANFT